MGTQQQPRTPRVRLGIPGLVRSDNGPGSVAQGSARMDRGGRSQDRLHHARQPWENGYCESFNSKLRDELLNEEIFYTLEEAKVLRIDDKLADILTILNPFPAALR